METELFCACIIDQVERLTIVFEDTSPTVRVLGYWSVPTCKPLLTVPLDSVSPQFLRDLTQDAHSRVFSRLVLQLQYAQSFVSCLGP